MPAGVDQRPIDVPEHEQHRPGAWQTERTPMLDRLAIPPRLALRALDDMHTVADTLRELAANSKATSPD